jgi:threonyl-tRNA synthetase
VWLAPEQVRVITIADTHNEFAEKIAGELFARGFRATADLASERMNAKIRNAQLAKIPYMAVVGDREVESSTVALRKRDGSRHNELPVAELVELVAGRVAERSGEL